VASSRVNFNLYLSSSSSSSVGPVGNGTDVLQPSGLLYSPYPSRLFGRSHVRENWPVILPEIATSTSIQGSFTCRKSATWDRRLYFPSEGRRAEDFCALKNPDGFGRV